MSLSDEPTEDEAMTKVYVVTVTYQNGVTALVIDESDEGWRPAAYVVEGEANARRDEWAENFPKATYEVACHDFGGKGDCPECGVPPRVLHLSTCVFHPDYMRTPS